MIGFKSNKIIIRGSALRTLVKALLTILIIYEGWYIEKYDTIAYLLQGLAILIVGVTCVMHLKLVFRKVKVSPPAIEWFLFGLIALIAGIPNQHNAAINDALFTYFSFFAVCVCAGVVTKDGDDTWIANTIIATVILCVVSVLFDGYLYKNGQYYAITMGKNNNPNTLGMMMAIGSFYLLNPKGKISKMNWTARILITCICGYVVLYSGSRSALLCLIAVIAISLFFRYKDLRGYTNSKWMKRLLFVFCGIIGCAFILFYLQNIEEGKLGINRLLEKFNSDSYSGRTNLYDAAWELFLKYPVLGIGYKCFSQVSQFEYFTHSTYMELLSCTGLVGFVLFMSPVIKSVVRAFKRREADNGRCLILLVLFLVEGFFGIMYYNLIFMMLLYLSIQNSVRLRYQKSEKASL